MVRYCARCGRKLKLFSYYSDDGLCFTCEIATQGEKDPGSDRTPAQIMAVVNQIATAKTIDITTRSFLLELDQFQRNIAYNALVDKLLDDRELDVTEVEMLCDLQKELGIDPTDNRTYLR